MPVAVWILLLVIIPLTLCLAVFLPMMRKHKEEQNEERDTTVRMHQVKA